MLIDLIQQYLKARTVWHAQFDRDEVEASNSAEWDAYMALGIQVLEFPCVTIEQISRKAAFILSDAVMLDILANSMDNATLKGFLTSMVNSFRPVEKQSTATPAESLSQVERLEKALEASECPSPVIADDRTVGACIASGQCGCGNRAALAKGGRA